MAKALHYDFANDLSLAARVGPTLSLTRATDASVMDYNNVLKTVDSGEARFTGGRYVRNHCPNSLTTYGLAGWTETRASVAASTETDPDGGTDATAILDDASAAITHRIQTSAITSTGVEDYTLSVYAKAGVKTWVGLVMQGAMGEAITYFDLVNGVVGSEAAGADDSGIEDVGDGWFRCWVSANTAADTTNLVRIYPAEANGDAVFDGQNGDICLHVWGVQVENVSGQDDDAPSDLIKSTTAALGEWYATKRRTNLVTYSNAPAGNWTNTRSAFAEDVGVDPFGGNEANSLTADSSGGQNSARGATPATDAGTGRIVTMSIYCKAGTLDWVRLLAIGDGANSINGYFDLTNGVAGLQSADIITSRITDAGSGWWRISVTFRTTNTDGIFTPQIRVAEADGDDNVDMDGVSSIWFYGMQLEHDPQDDGPSAYIETTTKPVSSGFDTALTPTGLLVEEVRTNVALRSQELDNASWNQGANETVTADDTVAPDGTLTADKVADDGLGGGTVYAGLGLTLSTTTQYAYSVYAKAGWSDWCRLVIGAFTGISPTCYFDLTNGVVGTASADVDDSGIEDVGNGWYRCWMVFTTAADGGGVIQLRLADADNDDSVTSDGTNNVYFWGGQCEAGSFPTSYIPTEAASVTRNADDISTSTTDWYNGDAGTFYLSASHLITALVPSTETAIGCYAGTSNDWSLGLSGGALGRYRSDMRSGGSAQFALISDHAAGLGATHQLAVGATADDAAFYLDGVQEGTDATVVMPANLPLTQLDVGNDNGGTHWNGHIKEIRYYDERLDNDTLEAMSNGIFPAAAGFAFVNDLVTDLVYDLPLDLTS